MEASRTAAITWGISAVTALTGMVAAGFYVDAETGMPDLEQTPLWIDMWVVGGLSALVISTLLIMAMAARDR